MHQDNIRKLIASVEGNVAAIEALGASDVTGVTTELRTSWAALVADLAIGPAPKTRKCPSCSASMIYDATRCGECWSKSNPP